MNKEVLNIYLYGGHRTNSKRLLGKWPIEVQLTTDGERAVWKVRRKYQFVYTAKDDITVTGIEVSVPLCVRKLLSKQLPMPASMPVNIQKGSTLTILFDRWQHTVTLT